MVTKKMGRQDERDLRDVRYNLHKGEEAFERSVLSIWHNPESIRLVASGFPASWGGRIPDEAV
jgi:hypothetical protein